VLTVQLPPPPTRFYLADQCRDTVYIYLLSPGELFLSALTRSWFCDTLVLTASSSPATSSPFFNIPRERVSWPLLMQSSLPPGHHANHLI
jgi:hypothetical protein